MAIVTLDQVSIGFMGPPLLDEVSCLIEAGDRIGLLGRNGAGKSTLMRLLLGEAQPDSGSVKLATGIRVAQLQQDVPRDLHGRVESLVLEGVPESQRDHEILWKAENHVRQLLDSMSLDPEAAFESLSSGMKRRVLLARALAGSPDLLLLDEPTNHLDIDSIGWLEEFLGRWAGTYLFVTHDRMFLRKLARRILEIDRGRLFDWSCDYDTFLKRKEDFLAAEEKQNALFDKRLAEEEVWIRQGIKARRTRNEGRVRALEKMRLVRQDRRKIEGKATLGIQESLRSGALVANVDKISFAYEGRSIVQDFSTTIMRGDKIGIIGPNGAGKTTLLRLLLGQLKPQVGHVRIGTNLQISYFDQLRDQLNPEETVLENVGEGNDTLEIAGQRRHVISYLQDFLFTPDRIRTQIRFLSGGERNRVMLAKMLSRPANLIVLDEPTNDLDAETLEVLEEQLVNFSGTILLVSHDRAFLNNVVTSTIVFEGDNVREYVGGYDDYRRVRDARLESEKENRKTAASSRKDPVLAKDTTAAPVRATKKLGFKEQRELEMLPKRIESLEKSIAQMHEQMGQAGFYQKPGPVIAAEQAKLADLEQQVVDAYARWEELEA